MLALWIFANNWEIIFIIFIFLCGPNVWTFTLWDARAQCTQQSQGLYIPVTNIIFLMKFMSIQESAEAYDIFYEPIKCQRFKKAVIAWICTVNVDQTKENQKILWCQTNL